MYDIPHLRCICISDVLSQNRIFSICVHGTGLSAGELGPRFLISFMKNVYSNSKNEHISDIMLEQGQLY